MNKAVVITKPKVKKNTKKKTQNEIIRKDNSDVCNVDVNPQSLLQQAITQNLPLETIEKLLAMRKELKEEWAEEQFFIALSGFQSRCPVINKDAVVDFKSERTGKQTYYKYATLDMIISQVKNHLKDFGFSYVIKTEQDKDSVTAICIAHHFGGHSEKTSFIIPVDKTAYMNDAQKVASALTYAKRYAFCNAFGIMTGDEDDDSISTQEINNNSTNNKNKKVNNNPVCPGCNGNQDVMPSKFPGKKWYCRKCKAAFNEKIKDITPKKEKKNNFNAEEKINELLNKVKPYKEKLNEKQIKFFINLKKKKNYIKDEYKKDSIFVDELIKSITKGNQEAPSYITDSDKETEFYFDIVS